MYKKEKIIYNKHTFSTAYDDLFEDRIKQRGMSYYLSQKVTNIHKTKKSVSAVVSGTNNYNVKINFLDDNAINVECECPYHKDTDIYCKHIYSLLLAISMENENKKLEEIFKNNCKEINKNCYDIDLALKENKKVLDSLIVSWAENLLKIYDKHIKDMEEQLNVVDYNSMIKQVNNSYYYLNETVDDYNKLVDYINIGTVKAENSTGGEKNSASNIIETTANNNMHLNTNKINTKKQKNSIKIKDVFSVIKIIFDILLIPGKILLGILALFGGISEGTNSSKSNKLEDEMDAYGLEDWQKDLVRKGEYDPWNFEEDGDLEEDDYYYEDDK